MRMVKHDAMAIHARRSENTLLPHDQISCATTITKHEVDEPKHQESTVVGLDIVKDNNSNNNDDNDNHMETSSPTDSTSSVSTPQQLPLESTTSSSSISPSSPLPDISTSQLKQQEPLSSSSLTKILVDNPTSTTTTTTNEAVASLLLLPTDQPQPQGSQGLDLWHAWLARSSSGDNRISANSQISPYLLSQYLNDVIVPMELSSSSSNGSSVPSESSSLIQTFITPILQLWHQQQQQEQPQSNTTSEQTKTSSVTCYPTIKSVPDDYGVITTAQRQDHDQRLTQLERLHRDTALNVSQLKDQVQQLLRHKGLHTDHSLEAISPVFSNKDTAAAQLTTSNGEKDQGENQKSSLSQQDVIMSSPTLQPRQTNLSARDYYHSDRFREDELISAIAKGLERYHARSLHVPHHYHPRGRPTWCHDEEYNRARHPHRHLSSSPGVTTHRAHNRELLDSSEPDQQPHSDMAAYEEIYPDERHAGFQQDLLIPGQQHQQRPTRNRKRSSSMNGPGALAKESVKQARSCSPLRPRTNSGETAVDGTVPTSPGHSGSVDGINSHAHAQSQPPSSNLASQSTLAYSTRSTNGTVLDAQEICKDLSSTPLNYNNDTTTTTTATAGYYTTPQHNYQNLTRSTRGHKYTHTPQLSRSDVYTDDEYASYLQQNPAYQQHSHEPMTAANSLTDQSCSPYFYSGTNTPYRGRHSKNQASISSQYSITQSQQQQLPHQYQRYDSRGYHAYNQLQQSQLSNYLDHQEEDVKPQHHQLYPQKNSRQEGTPIYVMNRQVNTVPELWKEWTVGLGPGNPSIRQLEAQYGPSWRTTSSAANFFSRRLRIINEIQRLIDFEGLSEEEAVNRLEARREQGVVVPGTEGVLGPDGQPAQTGGMSLHRLSEILRKKQL